MIENWFICAKTTSQISLAMNEVFPIIVIFDWFQTILQKSNLLLIHLRVTYFFSTELRLRLISLTWPSKSFSERFLNQIFLQRNQILERLGNLAFPMISRNRSAYCMRSSLLVRFRFKWLFISKWSFNGPNKIQTWAQHMNWERIEMPTPPKSV